MIRFNQTTGLLLAWLIILAILGAILAPRFGVKDRIVGFLGGFFVALILLMLYVIFVK